MQINALIHFNMNDLVQISKMSLDEYFLRLEAYQISLIDKREDLALQAWLNQTVQATKGSSKNPKPMFKKFDEFFDAQSFKNDIHKSFDPNYKPLNESEKEIEQRNQDEILKRFREREKQKEQQKQKGQPN